ncbi:MAG TPA: beta-1,6-N-acetylglucosaminyltransferase [Acidimicrobiales bacterium]|nr:beta-1,6-N-acetylglucosaminyltransferase [Acidimicrobiales bacterium]
MAGVLYFVTSYRNPRQTLRLVATIAGESRDAAILVHHDQFRTALDAADLRRAAPAAHLLGSPAPLEWGDFSVVDMHWRSFEWALRNRDFDWMILLSEQDYPVWPLDAVHRFLEESGVDAFIEAERVCPPASGGNGLASNRYFYSYTSLPGAAGAHRVPVPWAPALRALRQRAVDRVNRRPGRLFRAETYPDGMPTRFGVRRRTTPFSDSFDCWAGNAWFALSRRAVAEVVSFTGAAPSYRRYYRRTIVPEESATASIVLNSPGLRTAARNLHFERWSNRHSGHPDVLGRGDLEEIIGSGMPFARKFDLAVDPGVMDALDQHRRRSTGAHHQTT